MLILRRPWYEQPQSQNCAELDQSHWLYKDLVFVHTGNQGYVNGVAVEPITSGALKNAGCAFGGQFSRASSFKGNAAGYLEYSIPAIGTPITLSTWDVVSGSDINDSALLSISYAGSRSGVFLSRAGVYTNEIFFGAADGNGSVGNSSSGYGQVDTLRHVVGVAESSVLRKGFIDGALVMTGVDAKSAGGSVVGVMLHRGNNSPSVGRANSVLVAFPMVIRRVLTASEVARLYREQLDNPWSLFQPRSAFIPVAAGGGSPAVCLLSDGSLAYKTSAGGTDRKVYWTTASRLEAKLTAGAGDKLLTMAGGQLQAT